MGKNENSASNAFINSKAPPVGERGVLLYTSKLSKILIQSSYVEWTFKKRVL